MYEVKKEKIYLVLIILIIFCLFQYGIQKICGFTVYPDEFGYWASAAETVGYDWTEVTALGSYYSFGYSMLLVPILRLFRSGVSAYRAAIAVNMLFMCAGVLMLRKIVDWLCPEAGGIKRILISGIAVFYPSWIFYMQMTLTEALLMFLFAGIVCLFINFVQKQKLMTGAALAVMLMYAYCVHMRTIGIVAACMVTLLLWGLSEPSKRKQMLIIFGVVVLAGLTVIIIKRNVIISVFSKADAQTLSINDYSNQIQKLGRIFTADGISLFIKEVIAKLFYLGMASFGIFYWAVGWCVRETAGLIRKMSTKGTDTCTVQQWTACFLLTSVIAEILICSIYMHESNKIDCLIYGRYNEFLVPVLMVVGIEAMLESKWLFHITITMGVLSGLMMFPIFSVIEERNMERIRGYFIAGISYFIKEGDFNPYSYFRNTWIAGFAVMLLTAGVIWIVRKKKKMVWLLAIVMAVEILSGIQISTHYTYKVNRIGFEDLIITKKILENFEEGERVIYLNEGAPEFIDFHQMQLLDIPVHVINGEITQQLNGLGEYLITSRDTRWKDELEQIYNRHIISNNHVLYFNQT